MLFRFLFTYWHVLVLFILAAYLWIYLYKKYKVTASNENINAKYYYSTSVLAIIMIASSHSADQKVYEIARLKNEAKELRSAFVDGRSKLMRLKMESTIIKKVAAKGIKISEIPPQKIKVKTQN